MPMGVAVKADFLADACEKLVIICRTLKESMKRTHSIPQALSLSHLPSKVGQIKADF
jgi:hypothetical protein